MKVNLEIPSAWSEVSIGKFIELSALDNNKSNIAMTVERLAVLTDQDPEEINKLTLDQIEEVVGYINFVNEDPSEEFKKILQVGEIHYGLIDVNRISVGEYMDLEQYVQDGGLKNLHQILSILYRPLTTAVKEGYEIEKYETRSRDERAELFLEHLTVEDAYGASLFFSLFGRELAINTALSLKETMLETMKKTRSEEKIQQRRGKE